VQLGDGGSSCTETAGTCGVWNGPVATTTWEARTVPVGVIAAKEPSGSRYSPSTGEPSRTGSSKRAA
jgi:hypothetical protein